MMGGGMFRKKMNLKFGGLQKNVISLAGWVGIYASFTFFLGRIYVE
jgi:hypothetical protein